jgi:hypothetical protein
MIGIGTSGGSGGCSLSAAGSIGAASDQNFAAHCFVCRAMPATSTGSPQM